MAQNNPYPNNQGGFNQGGFNQGGFNQQGGFQGQGNYQGNGGNNNQGNNNHGNSSYDSFAEIEILGNLSTIKDPQNPNGERVHAYSKPMNNGAKVANANVAVNINGQDEAQYWKIEVWANSPDRASMHNFLMDHCSKGRKVLVKGTPLMNKDNNGQIWPTIRVSKIIGFGAPANQQEGQNSGGQQQQNNQNQGGFQQQGQQGNFQQQQGFGQPQGGFQQQGGFGQSQGGFQQQPNNGFQGQPGFNPQQGAPGAQGGFGAPQGGFGAPQGGFGAPQH